MKRFVILLLSALILVLCGCSLLERKYEVITDHDASYYETSEQQEFRAENLQDIVTDLLMLIEDCNESGKIWLYTDMSVTETENLAAKACEEIQKETPLGAYAVEYITYTVQGGSNERNEISFQITYSKTKKQIEDIVHTNGSNALEDLLKNAITDQKSELVLQINYFDENKEEVSRIIGATVNEINPTLQWSVKFFPEKGKSVIVEIVLENQP